MGKIEGIEIYQVRMPLVYPFRTAFGNDDAIESILLKMHSDDQYGWGESSPWELPAYSAESATSVFHHLKNFLLPPIVGKSFDSVEQLQGELSGFKGNYFAKAAIDCAWWDLQIGRASCRERV